MAHVPWCAIASWPSPCFLFSPRLPLLPLPHFGREHPHPPSPPPAPTAAALRPLPHRRRTPPSPSLLPRVLPARTAAADDDEDEEEEGDVSRRRAPAALPLRLRYPSSNAL